jgi:hypothetical protein
VSNILRALLEEAGRIEVPDEPPPYYARPLDKDEKVIGRVPLDIRRLYMLAVVKAQELVDLARVYRSSGDPDGSLMLKINRLHLEANLLEECAENSVMIAFVEDAECQGSVNVRAGWIVAWNPLGTNDEEEEEEEEVEPEKPLLN